MKTNIQTKTIARLKNLNTMLNTYSHRWGENPSQRMYNWVDEYQDIKDNNRPIWDAYCKATGLSPDHDAYDCMA